MKRYKKVIIVLISIFSLQNAFSVSLEELINYTLESNSEIKASLNTYETVLASVKGFDGAYAPGLSLTSSTTIPKDYEWNTMPNAFDSCLSFKQPLPGGTTISLDTNYYFETMRFLDTTLVSQYPKISLSVSQSLMPFWLQGEKKDPIKASANKQKEYYYNQYLYTKKRVLIGLFQNYANAFISYNNIRINQNYIKLYEEQIEALKILKYSGSVTQSKILETENQKWSSQQNLMSAQADYLNSILALKKICGTNFDDNSIIFADYEVSGVDIFQEIDEAVDPLELAYKLKIELAEVSRVLEKQSYAPTLSFSLQPNWSLGMVEESDWADAWEDMGKPSTWKASLSVDLYPLFSGIAKQNKKKYTINHEDVEREYSVYMQQKAFTQKQYETLLQHYILQRNTISTLYDAACAELEDYKTQFQANAISKLDYDTVQTRVENSRLTKEIIEINVWLYELLKRLH